MGYNKFSKNVLITNHIVYQDNPKLMEVFGIHSKTNSIIQIFYDQNIDFRIECVKEYNHDAPILVSPEYGRLNYEEIMNRFN